MPAMPTSSRHDDDMQLAAGTERIPPRADPFVPQKRMRDPGTLHRFVPLGLQRNERRVVADDFEPGSGIRGSGFGAEIL
jgi:hypothetical protein